jgi:subfamily B ATP-binding cassette protein MsbA
VASPANPVLFAGFDREIRFEDVWFAYEDETWVLRSVSLAIPKGATVAFVGPSGAGKSTLADMIPRFYDPAKGRVAIDNTDLRQISLLDLRSRIAVVSQEVLLFHDTIRNNIAYGLPGASIQAIRQAANNAYAEDFIEALPQKYDTVVGDRGIRLSGGERQRIALARAFLRNTPVLILDEATSALDNESEVVVQQAISNLLKGRTNVVIAHRLSTIRNADIIYAMDQGKIVEQGTHASLLSQKGLYHRLYSLHQFVEG